MARALGVALAVWAGLISAPAESFASSAATPNSTSIAFGQPVAIPIGYYDLCMRQPSVCRPRAGSLSRARDGAVRATPEMFERLQAVTVRVNRAIRPIADASTPGLKEWRINVSAGNC